MPYNIKMYIHEFCVSREIAGEAPELKELRTLGFEFERDI